MLYHYLAESLSELGMLTSLIDKMEVINAPLPELTDVRSLPDEIRRIKKRASTDILIFGMYSGIYLNNNITKINYLILRLLEILIKLPECAIMNEKERYQYDHCIHIKEELKELSVFFYKLNETITN
jgi:hypothetical protein